MEKLKEELLELLARYNASIKWEETGIILEAEVRGDYFYFKEADVYGFDE